MKIPFVRTLKKVDFQRTASLGLSEKTVRNHITRVFDKIGVEHRYQAIVRARDAGLGRAI